MYAILPSAGHVTGGGACFAICGSFFSASKGVGKRQERSLVIFDLHDKPKNKQLVRIKVNSIYIIATYTNALYK